MERLPFVLSSALSASLLFFLEPMVARVLMPLLGGTAALWNTCLVFFQGCLLLGYAYVHEALRRLGVVKLARLHTLILLAPFLVMPLRVVASDAALGGIEDASGALPSSPVLPLLLLLTKRVGLPFFALSTTTPLLQAWWAARKDPLARDPYPLYVASNVGSLASVFAYPLVVDRFFGVTVQTQVFRGAYAVFVAAMVGCIAVVLRDAKRGTTSLSVAIAEPEPRRNAALAEPPSLGDALPEEATGLSMPTWAPWLLFAAVPSSLLQGVTSYISMKIAPMPLLWAFPMALYLLSFILVFSNKPFLSSQGASRVLWVLLSLALFLHLCFDDGRGIPELAIGLHLTLFFFGAMVCHGRLAESRPHPRFLTQFYLAMALGGVLGAMANALLAPLLFRSLYEYPLALFFLALLRVPPRPPRPSPGAATESSRSKRGRDDLLWAGLVAGTTLLVGWKAREGFDGSSPLLLALYTLPILLNGAAAPRPRRFAGGLAAIALSAFIVPRNRDTVLWQARSFFGPLVVEADENGRAHTLVHGDTLHGRQWQEPSKRREPTAYYAREGPLGDVFSLILDGKAPRQMAVVGLGAGTAAAYARPDDLWTFVELDPEVVKIARNPRLFSYLKDAFPNDQGLVVEVGDGRLVLERAKPETWDAILLDAFGSDAVPVHLLTLEALQMYRSRLRPDGVLVMHLSNRWFNLPAPIATGASELGISIRCRVDSPTARDERIPSTWCALSQDPHTLDPLARRPTWVIPTTGRSIPWTDDRANVLDVRRPLAWDR